MAHQLNQYEILKNLHSIYIRAGRNRINVQESINDQLNLLRTLNVEVPAVLNGLTVNKLETLLKKQALNFVEPRPFQLGIHNTTQRAGSEQVNVVKRSTFYYFNIMDTVMAILSKKKLFLEVINETKSIDNAVRSNLDALKFSDSSYLPQIVDVNDDFSPVTITIRILLYGDDFEVTNALGSKKCKITGFYFKVLNLKPTGKLHHIFAYAFANANDIKTYGYNMIYVPFTNEMKSLMNHPPTVELHQRQVTLKFVFVGLTGDSLFLNENFNIKNGHALRFCRSCLILRGIYNINATIIGRKRDDAHYYPMMRTIKASQGPAKTKLLKLWGYTSTNDLLLRTLNFSPWENGIFDRFHDFFQGITKVVVIQIFRFMIEKGIFNLKFLNNRIKNFQYGEVNNKDKPSFNITEDQIKSASNTRLKQNGVQMHVLIRVLPFLVLDKLFSFVAGNASEEDKKKAESIIDFLTLHLEITQLVSSRFYLPHHLNRLNDLIIDHNSLYQLLFKTPLINKFHHLLHYVAMIILYGPPIHLETTRFEALHKLFKDRMSVCHSFTNVPFIIARHYSFWLSHYMDYEIETPTMDAKSCETFNDPDLGIIIRGTKLTYHDIEYSQGMVLCIDTNEVPIGGFPQFGVIKSMEYREEKLYFRVQILRTNAYSHMYASYHVYLENNSKDVVIDSLPSVYPMALWRTFESNIQNDEYYVSMKTNEFT